MTIPFILLLLTLSALFSGLTIGLMSLDLTTLRIKAKKGDGDAQIVLKIREKGTELLVALLLANTLINSGLAVIMTGMFSGLVASIVSTVLIFIFGELAPQALISRHALKFGVRTAPFVTFVLFVSHPIAKPIALFIDKVLGREIYKTYTKKDLLEILEDEHAVEEGDVDMDEKRIVKGSLSFSHKKVGDVLTPSSVVSRVHVEDIIDDEYLQKLKETGYSRLPVQSDNHNQCVGVLYLKDLLGVKLPAKVSDVMDGTVHFVSTEDKLDIVLDSFIKTKMHLFIVLDEFGTFTGVVTLEDIVEEILGAEIMDEGDEDADLREVARRRKGREI